MKSSSSSMWSSLALHLLALGLLLATLHIVGQATAASATDIVSTTPATTTAHSPSLRAPHRRSSIPTRVMSTQRKMSTIASTARQRQPVARSSTASTLSAHAAPSSPPPPAPARSSSSSLLVSSKHMPTVDGKFDSKTTRNSVRPLRSVDVSTANTPNRQPRNNGARQNRSLQSASSATRSTNSNSNSNGLTAAGSTNQQKHDQQRVDRRHHFRTNQYGSHEPTSLPLAVSTTTTTTTASSAERHQRRSKESSMPLEDVDTVTADDDNGKPELQLRKHDSQAHKNATQQRQTAKTPRMIHRLVAGHIQNAAGSSSYQVSAVSGNNTILKSNAAPKAKVSLAQQQAHSKPTKTSAKYSSTATTTTTTSTASPVELRPLSELHTTSEDEANDDDEALLDDPGDFDNWDNGILRLSAGSGKESSKLKKHSKIDDSKKTLSDQVRDGKYGLIEKEIFRREPKRPGVLSYLPNKEVPIDNDHNYGGLQEDDIWLAEDHLLVIKGGTLNEEKPHEEPWPPIDDYDAPGRQIKIPPNPKVPPPFPVQLEENGPIQFIGNNKFTVVYPVANESIPVYTAGPETDSAPSENDSDNEKNTITRPGTPQDVAQGGGDPHYVYPAPYPSWLFNNQTFVNPLLSNARPITFPGLGPFPLGRNGSLDNVNGTDFLDEDDPTLYYPPAYSFVYKNNYTSLVPPGPLVPGIVLPPPANQFSRLEKSEKATTSSPSRQRIPLPTASTTARTATTAKTTTTTTTTTEPTFKNVITKISEYTPKIINITPPPPIVSTAIPPTPTVKLPSTPRTTPTSPTVPPISIDPIPVPVAIPIPVYPGRPFPSSRPNVLSFIPTTPEPTRDTLSKSNPIYYEYFEAKRQPIKTNVIDDFLASTVEPPPSPKPIKLYATSKRPYKSQQQRNYLQQQRLPFKENVVYITPKPEVRYKVPSQEPIYKPRPLENFEREVSALRETLRYYQNQQLRDNAIPRTPKVKSIYEFSFDASKNLQPPPADANINDFRPPSDFDEEPFKPMVTYSPPMNDENSFNPMAYDKVDIEASQKLRAAPKETDEQPIYQPTTTLIPITKNTVDYQPIQQTQQTQSARLKKQRLSAKYLQDPFIETAYDQQSQQQPTITQRPWVAVGKVPLENYENAPEKQTQRYEQYQYPVPKQRVYTGGYFYGPPSPPLHSRQNNRFYDEPFQQPPPVRKIINYRQRYNPQYQQQQQQHQPHPLPHHHHHHHQQQQQQQQPYWNLENDTYVNYAPNRPPLNPDAEFIDPYQTVPYAGQSRYPPPAVSHQSQYYAPPRQQIPLHRDILVNYRQPLPPINPDAEFISHPNVVRNQANPIYRSDSYRNQPSSSASLLLDNADEQESNVYYVSPKYRRANNSNNNNHNNNNGNNANNNNNNNNSNNNASSNVNKQGREARNGNSDINNGK